MSLEVYVGRLSLTERGTLENWKIQVQDADFSATVMMIHWQSINKDTNDSEK